MIKGLIKWIKVRHRYKAWQMNVIRTQRSIVIVVDRWAHVLRTHKLVNARTQWTLAEQNILLKVIE